MAAYLDIDEFKLRTIIPSDFVDEVEAAAPGFYAAQAELWSRWMDTRLGKRYSSPFAVPFPEALKGWLTRILTLRVYLRRGIEPGDKQYETIAEDAKDARDEIKEAADSVTGLYDLPLKDSELGSAIVYGAPVVYSEQSPYVNHDVARDIATHEDCNRRGSN